MAANLLWFSKRQRTYAANENRKKYFSFVVKTDFSQSHNRFDQCGIVVYLDSGNWIKASVEYENDKYQRLGSVVTNDFYSDWATVDISADISTIWYRLSRRGSDFCIECSSNGADFRQMRICHLNKSDDIISFGVYACSPGKSSFTALFSDMSISECKWHEHCS